jgi:hypothetical protein
MPIEQNANGKRHFVLPPQTHLVPRKDHRISLVPHFHHHYLRTAFYDTPLHGAYAIILLIEDYWYCEFLESEFQITRSGIRTQREVRQQRREIEIKTLQQTGDYPYQYMRMFPDSLLTLFAANTSAPLTGYQVDRTLSDFFQAFVSDAQKNYCPSHRQPFVYAASKIHMPYGLSGFLMELTERGYLTRTPYDKIKSKHKRFSYRYWPW